MTSHYWRGHQGLYQDGEPGVTLDNSGDGSLSVPGFGHPVPIELPPTSRFAHGFNDWSQHRLTAREIAMLQVMNSITDCKDWYLEVRDANVTATWEEEALTRHLISPAAWKWCLQELKDKAELYKCTRLTHVLDSASRVCKSDELISAESLNQLANGVENLAASETGDLVSPDMFPLAYGITRVLRDGGRVGRVKAVDFVGHGEKSKPQVWKCPRRPGSRCDGLRRGNRGAGRAGWHGIRGGGPCARCGRTASSPERSWERRGDRFSATYQWLPSEVDVSRDHNGKPQMRISSYINNLHPRRHASLYGVLERSIEASIQPWNEVLVYRDRGRTPERIRTFGVQWTMPPTCPVDLSDLDEVIDQGSGELHDKALQWLCEYLAEPENPRAPSPSSAYPFMGRSWKREFKPSEAIDDKYHRVKRWLHPEPGVSFTYDEWARGRNTHAVVPGKMVRCRDWVELPPKADHEFYSIAIEKDFAHKGLQVIIEIGSIDLTPDKPTHLPTEWQLSGLPNDHIVATTMIYLSSSNITSTSGSLSFRVEAHLDPSQHRYGTETNSNPYHPRLPLAEIYGCSSHLELGSDEDENMPGGPAVQVLGTVSTPDGRVIAWPNVMQHRVESVQLLDPSIPGRRRFLKIHLVDPHYRICSTRNVPPQQSEWWSEAGLDCIDWAAYEMPAELAQEIEALVGEFPLSLQEAKYLRQQYQEERREKYKKVNDNIPCYNFGDWAAEGSASAFHSSSRPSRW